MVMSHPRQHTSLTSMSSDAAADGNANPTDAVFKETELESRLTLIRQQVARPIPTQPFEDNTPALIPFHDNVTSAAAASGGGIIIGSWRHAANIPLLKSMNVTAVLNCASGGIARLPVDDLKENGIRYCFTNCRQDSHTYPILHEKKKQRRNSTDEEDASYERYICSHHLEVSNALYTDIRRENGNNGSTTTDGNVLFFCVAGQNRSATLAVATLMLHGKPLEEILAHCSKQRPFVLENVGFQRQIVELEAILNKLSRGASELLKDIFSTHWKQLQYSNDPTLIKQYKKVRMMDDAVDNQLLNITDRPIPLSDVGKTRTKSEYDLLAGTKVEIELLIPGLCTMEVRIPVECTIQTVKRCLIKHANDNLLRHGEQPAKVAKAWVVLAMFGYDDMYDIPLENEAVEMKVQLERMESMFGLTHVIKGKMSQ